jgi:hypothetical protein
MKILSPSIQELIAAATLFRLNVYEPSARNINVVVNQFKDGSSGAISQVALYRGPYISCSIQPLTSKGCLSRRVIFRENVVLICIAGMLYEPEDTGKVFPDGETKWEVSLSSYDNLVSEKELASQKIKELNVEISRLLKHRDSLEKTVKNS